MSSWSQIAKGNPANRPRPAAVAPKPATPTPNTVQTPPEKPKPLIRSEDFKSVLKSLDNTTNKTSTPNTIGDVDISKLSKTARRKLKKKLAEQETDRTPEIQPDQDQQTTTTTTTDQARQIRGLINTGNLCFMNTIFQVLFSCNPFNTLVKSLSKYSFPCPSPILSAMIAVLETYENGNVHQAFRPDIFISSLRRFSKLKDGRQQQEDVPEFLNWLLDQLHEELLKIGAYFGVEAGNDIENETEEDDGWAEVGKKGESNKIHVVKSNKSPISDIFESQIRNTINSKNSKNAHIQPYKCLPLDISSPNIVTLNDAFQEFLSKEYIDLSHSSQMYIDKLPRVLTLQLVRFGYSEFGARKIHKQISFSTKLQLSKSFLSPSYQFKQSNADLQYSLFAVVVHHGQSIHNGHYTCYLLNTQSGTWLHCDDDVISYASEQDVVSSEAYLLFYAKTR